MKQIAITVVSIMLWVGVFGQSNSCKELFISEMIEGNAPNRALELFNPSDTTIDLSSFSIRLFQNGQLTPLIIPLSGTLPPKSTFVIAHPAAKPEIKTKADMLDPQLTFDGNDAIVLEKTGGTQVDKIGEVGVDPGTAGWFVPPSGSTKEQTLRRKYPVDKGETDWGQGKNEWTVHPKDSVSNLRQHQSQCKKTLIIFDDTTVDSATFATGIDNLTGSENQLSVYPNPTSGRFSLIMNLERGTELTINLYSVYGELLFKKVASSISGEHRQQIDLSIYARGIYYVQVIADNNIAMSKVIYQ